MTSDGGIFLHGSLVPQDPQEHGLVLSGKSLGNGPQPTAPISRIKTSPPAL